MITFKFNKIWQVIKSVILWIITALSLFGLYSYFVANKNIDNKKIVKQNKKIKEAEKVSKKASENSEITDEQRQKVRQETDRILNEKEENNEKIKIDSDTADSIIDDIINGNR